MTHRSVLRISPKYFQPSRDILSQIVKIGSSSMFRSGLAVVAAIVLNNIAGSISDAVLAGIGVTNKIMMFPFSVILGFGSGFQPVTGFNWGAKRFDRVLESYWFSAKCAIAISTVMAVILGLFANQVILLFSEADAEMQAIGALSIRLQCIALPIHAWVAVVNMFCSGLGKAKGALLLATARQGSCFLPIVYPLAWLFEANGVAAVQAVADVLTLCLAAPLIRKVLKEVKTKAAEHGQLTA
jgi:Na+-driven multidrug efflux pump